MFTCSVLKDFNGAIVDLSNGLHLNIVAIATIKSLPVDVVLKILISHILGKVVHVLELEGRGRERERERGGQERKKKERERGRGRKEKERW